MLTPIQGDRKEEVDMGLDYTIYKINNRIETQEDLESINKFDKTFKEVFNSPHTSDALLKTYYVDDYVNSLSAGEVEDEAAKLRARYSALVEKYPNIQNDAYKEEVAYFRNWWVLFNYTDELYSRHTQTKSFNLYGRQMLSKTDIEDFISTLSLEEAKENSERVKVLEKLIQDTDFENETLYAIAWG